MGSCRKQTQQRLSRHAGEQGAAQYPGDESGDRRAEPERREKVDYEPERESAGHMLAGAANAKQADDVVETETGRPAAEPISNRSGG